jgi:Phage integrase, N-terminal SAM-like domain
VKLLDQVRHQCRLRHYSIRTEDTYAAWIERFIRYHGVRHPDTTRQKNRTAIYFATFTANSFTFRKSNLPVPSNGNSSTL